MWSEADHQGWLPGDEPRAQHAYMATQHACGGQNLSLKQRAVESLQTPVAVVMAVAVGGVAGGMPRVDNPGLRAGGGVRFGALQPLGDAATWCAATARPA
jgi:hypothetical protein